jgi:predicted transposase/invertase (TIGR01784 family)
MEYKMLSPLLDFVFKDLFGDVRRINILEAFLKQSLSLPPEEYGELTITDPHLKREHEDDKLCIVDVKVKTTSGRIINVEIQTNSFPELTKRFVLYSAKLLTGQIKRGGKYRDIEPVVSIIILTETLVPGDKNYYNTYRIRNVETGVELSNILEINLLELPKLPPEPDGSGLWTWAKFLKSESKEEFEMIAEQDPAVKQAVGRIAELSEDEVNQMLADEKWKRDFDYHAQMRANYNNGYKEAETKYQKQIRQKDEQNRQAQEEIRELQRRLAEK